MRLLVLIAALLLSCGEAAQSPAPAPEIIQTCVDTDARACLCDATRLGLSTCVDGAFGACVCPEAPEPLPTCDAGFALYGGSCVNIDECALGLDDCQAPHLCNDTHGSFHCDTCAAGYDFVEDDCVDIDECATVSCEANAHCENSDGGYSCECDDGHVRDDGACRLLRDVLVQEFEAGRKMRLTLSGVTGAMDAFGASRIGGDFQVIAVPSGEDGGTAKRVGHLSYPNLTLLRLTTSPLQADELDAWALGDAPETKTMVITLREPDGGEPQVSLVVAPFGGFTHHQVASKRVFDRVELVVSDLSTHAALVTTTYPDCPRPAQVVEIAGVSPDIMTNVAHCYPPGTLTLPAYGSSDVLRLPQSRGHHALLQWFENFADGLFDRRSIAIGTIDTNNQYTRSHILFEGWPSSITVFDPTLPYGDVYLHDVTIVADRVEEP